MEREFSYLANKIEKEDLKLIEHEICNSLNVIIGFAEIMKNNDVKSEIKQEYLNHIISSSNKLLEFTNVILNRKA